MVSIVPSKCKEKSGSRGINSGLTYYFSLNIVILSYAWTKLSVTLMGVSEPPLYLTSVSFCGKPKMPIVAIGALLSFNYVSIKPVMSSKSRYMVGSKSRWAKKQTIPYVQSVPRRYTSCLPPPPSKFTASRNTDYINIHQTLSVFKKHFICGNKMPTRCNRGFYCRSYCLLNMFRAPLCPSSGAQECYTVVAACGISWCKGVKSNFVS